MQLIQQIQAQQIQAETLPQLKDRLLLTYNRFQDRMVAVFVVEVQEDSYLGIVAETLNGYTEGEEIRFKAADFNLPWKIYQGFTNIPYGIFHRIVYHEYYQCEDLEVIALCYQDKTFGFLLDGEQLYFCDLDSKLQLRDRQVSWSYITLESDKTPLLTATEFFEQVENAKQKLILQDSVITLVLVCSTCYLIIHFDFPNNLIEVGYMTEPCHYQNSFLHALTTKRKRIFYDKTHQLRSK